MIVHLREFLATVALITIIPGVALLRRGAKAGVVPIAALSP